MLRKKNIFVIMGGKSPEHEISVITGKEIVNSLNSKKYNVFPLYIPKSGRRWVLLSKNSLKFIEDPFADKTKIRDLKLVGKNEFGGIENISEKPDLVFIALHGLFGEDGTIQGMLELLGIKYTGSGVLASALGMDKLMFRKLMLQEKIPIPKYIAIKRGDSLEKLEYSLGKLPYFIKPSNQGSSIGTSLVKTQGELYKGLILAWKYSKYALIDEYLKGKEVTCGVLGNDNPFALPVVEIVPKKAEYFDYKSKYSESGSYEIVPARISGKLTRKVQEFSVKIHKILNCRGFSRVDFILRDDKNPFVLEINTIPGMTPISLLPKEAKAAGMSYPKLIETIINYAFE